MPCWKQEEHGATFSLSLHQVCNSYCSVSLETHLTRISILVSLYVKDHHTISLYSLPIATFWNRIILWIVLVVQVTWCCRYCTSMPYSRYHCLSLTDCSGPPQGSVCTFCMCIHAAWCVHVHGCAAETECSSENDGVENCFKQNWRNLFYYAAYI